MNAKLTVAALKADIVALITTEVDRLHAEALDIESKVVEIGEVFDAIEDEMIKADREQADERAYRTSPIGRMRNRVQSYMVANGTDKLTRRQSRRINKKSRKTGVNPWALSFDYSAVFAS